MKRLAFYAIIIGATLALLILFWQFRSVVILLLLSLMLTAALRPSVDFLVERRLRPSLARIIVYLFVFGVLAVGLFLIGERLLAELQSLSNYLVVLYDNTYRVWSSGSGFQQAIAGRLPAPDALDQVMGGSNGAAALRLLFGVTQNAVSVVAGLVVVIAFSLYWSADRSHFERLWLSLLPAGSRIQARRVWQTTESAMGSYVRSESIQSFLAVVLLIIGYMIVGLDYPILAGLLAGVVWLIPLVGFLLAALLSFLLGMASAGGIATAVGALVLTVAVLAFLEFVVEPRLFSRSRFSGVLIVVVMVMMVDAYGLTGFLIAPPLAVALQVLVSHIIHAVRRPPPPMVEFDTLAQRLRAIDARYEAQSELEESPEGNGVVMPPEVVSLQKRLEQLIDEAQRVSIERS